VFDRPQRYGCCWFGNRPGVAIILYLYVGQFLSKNRTAAHTTPGRPPIRTVPNATSA